MNLLSDPLALIISIAALIAAITIHEFSHALLADRLGDPTPRLQGRLTLNPLAHLDPLGTLMLILVHFGWGKPVQFDPFNLRNPRRDAAIISLAGPASNLITAVIASLFLHLFMAIQLTVFGHSGALMGLVALLLITFLRTLIAMSVILAIFNLVPIHPLDGFKIVGGILPPDQAREWYALERYGMLFLLFLIFPIFSATAPISWLISPVINFVLSLLLPGSAGFI